VYRSDKLSLLTEADLAHLGGLGLRTICDFRYDRECDEDPSRLWAGVRVERLPVGSAPGDNPASLEERIRAGELTRVSTEDIAVGYLHMLEQRAELFGRLVALVADRANHSVVIHCTAGKDRTGLGAALILGGVGVADDVIVEDYRLTDDYRSTARLAEIGPQLDAVGLDLDDLKVLFTAPAETMALTLEKLRDRWGGIVGYLTGVAGVSEATLTQLREALVE